uniref:Uncharacterized protein n=1 Tax=Setaria italica TaxID=4555 RepID=K3Y1S0_SETIT
MAGRLLQLHKSKAACCSCTKASMASANTVAFPSRLPIISNLMEFLTRSKSQDST